MALSTWKLIPLIPLQSLPQARSPQLRCHQPPVLYTAKPAHLQTCWAWILYFTGSLKWDQLSAGPFYRSVGSLILRSQMALHLAYLCHQSCDRYTFHFLVKCGLDLPAFLCKHVWSHLIKQLSGVAWGQTSFTVTFPVSTIRRSLVCHRITSIKYSGQCTKRIKWTMAVL